MDHGHRSPCVTLGVCVAVSFGLQATGEERRPIASTEGRSDWAPSPAGTVVEEREEGWRDTARFFFGVRMSAAFPPAGSGIAPLGGLELGVAAKSGVGFGLHLLGATNVPDLPALNIPKSQYAVGALADLRWYIQTVEPLTLYPTLAVGFLAGPATGTNTNAVLPMLNPGFGARVLLDPVYVAFEFGFSAFYIPFVTLSIGWEPERRRRTPARALVSSAPSRCAECAPCAECPAGTVPGGASQANGSAPAAPPSSAP